MRKRAVTQRCDLFSANYMGDGLAGAAYKLAEIRRTGVCGCGDIVGDPSLRPLSSTGNYGGVLPPASGIKK